MSPLPLESSESPCDGRPDCGKYPQKRHRRGHTKSRAGCRNCKRRKVKCDEIKSACCNCTRFAMVYDFSPLSKQQVSVESSPPDLTKKQKPGRPRKDWIQDSSDLQGSSDCSSTPSLALGFACPALPLSPGLISVVDYLDLMHCWTVHTAATVGETKLWREDMPPLSFRHPHLCHIILAMAAQHSSRLKPLESQRYTTLAEHHYELAVREATVNLASLSLDNAQPMYASMMLISLYYFAKGPGPGEFLVFTKGKKVPWMSLLQGVRFIFETLGHSAIFHGILSIKFEVSEERNVNEVTTTPVSTCQHWQQPLSDLLHMIEQSPEKHATCCAQEAEQLVDSYKATYGTENKPINCNGGKIQDVMGWLYRMDPGFIAQPEAENPVLLILLAYFAVLLKSLESYWFMKGWAKHLLLEVNELLDPQHKRWLAWPASQILPTAMEDTVPLDPLP